MPVVGGRGVDLVRKGAEAVGFADKAGLVRLHAFRLGRAAFLGVIIAVTSATAAAAPAAPAALAFAILTALNLMLTLMLTGL